MKKVKYLPILLMLVFSVCMFGVGVYAINQTSIGIAGLINITSGDTNCKIEYSVKISNASTSCNFSKVAPNPIYINSTNSETGELISFSNSDKDVSLGNIFYSSYGDYIEDIGISITLKNKSFYPVLVNFAFGNTNTVGIYSDNTLQEVYLSDISQTLGNSDVLCKTNGIGVYDFFLKLKDPTKDLTSSQIFNLNISFNSATGDEDIVQAMPITYATMVTDDIVNYMQIADNKVITEAIIGNRSESSKCKPFVFEYTMPQGVNSSSLALSTNLNFENAKTYTNLINLVLLENLLVNTNYYYQIKFYSSGVEVGGKCGIIKTQKTPRMLTIDGALNTRDIGGWQQSINIKQGLIYRGTEIDGLVESSYLATTKGLNVLKELGVVTDFDLRGKSDASPISGAKKIYYSSPQYNSALTSTHSSVVKNIFAALAEPTNYPMYLHCTYGCDRTGTICYLLEALLGASDLELAIEYELSALSFSSIKRNSDSFVALTNAVQALSGSNTQQKVEGYLKSIGITDAQIQSIKDIFLV